MDRDTQFIGQSLAFLDAVERASRAAHMRRPVLVIGVDAPDATNGAHHDLQATAAYLASLPPQVRDHLPARVVERLEPVIQHHVIEGLLAATY